MKLTVKDCLKLDAFQLCDVLAGKRSMGTPIRSISVMDAVDIKTAVESNGVGGQFVLTAFYGMPEASVRAEVIKKLAETGIAGLVVLHATEEIRSDEKMIKAAEDAELPLIILSDANPVEYSHVIEQVMNEFLVGDKDSNSLINDTITQLMDFDKYTTFQQAIKEAALTNDFQVVLLSKDFNPVLVVETKHNVTVEDAVRSLQRKKDESDGNLYPILDIEGITAFWGVITIGSDDYFLMIVDNDERYSAVDITKLAEIIELAIGMWKYSPERDVKAELMRALMRGNSALAYSLKEELDIDERRIASTFVGKGLINNKTIKILADWEKKTGCQTILVNDEDVSYGMIIRARGKGKGKKEAKEEDNNLTCGSLYESLIKKIDGSIICHYGASDGIESVVNGFKLINETMPFADVIYPHKRIFSKYEMSLISNCISIHMNGGHIKKNYIQLLDPFKTELSAIKSRQLMTTLETLVLDAGLSGNLTAKLMGVHSNTVQYRLKRINEMLGVDITENSTTPSLTIALALRRLAKVVG